MGPRPLWGANKVIHADALLYCIGRQGATDRLNLAAAGLTADSRGRLKVNEFYQTEVPHIYAAGDVIGSRRWRRQAWSRAGWRRATCSARSPSPRKPLFPYGIYTIPEISMVGATEQA